MSEPSKYYCEEGSNLYFKLTKDGTPVDPFLFLGECRAEQKYCYNRILVNTPH